MPEDTGFRAYSIDHMGRQNLIICKVNFKMVNFAWTNNKSRIFHQVPQFQKLDQTEFLNRNYLVVLATYYQLFLIRIGRVNFV